MELKKNLRRNRSVDSIELVTVEDLYPDLISGDLAAERR